MNDPTEICELTSSVLTSPADALLGEAIAATLRLRPEERAADFEGRMREIEAFYSTKITDLPQDFSSIRI